LKRIDDKDALLRQWACLCIGQYWMNHADGKNEAIQQQAHQKLFRLLSDSVPEVRAAVLYALGTFIGDLDRTEQIMNIEHNIAITTITAASKDASPMVRKELVITLSFIVHSYIDDFVKTARDTLDDNFTRRTNGYTSVTHEDRPNSVYDSVWNALLNFSVDPSDEVAIVSSGVVDYVHGLVLQNADAKFVVNVRDLLHKTSLSEAEVFRGAMKRSIAGSIASIELPVKSIFFDWSCEYFREPQTRVMC
jgi:regulator-associated protein of mTOR